MLDLVEFTNYRVLRSAQLPLGWNTLILGPNGSGKSTAIRGIQYAAKVAHPETLVGPRRFSLLPPERQLDEKVFRSNLSMGLAADEAELSIGMRFGGDLSNGMLKVTQSASRLPTSQRETVLFNGDSVPADILSWIGDVRVFSLHSKSIAASVKLHPNMELGEDGANLSVVMTQLQDGHPERFEGLNGELRTWLPEFDRVLFSTPGPGERSFSLRKRGSRNAIASHDLSDGTLYVLCLLTLAWLPSPPRLICLEEPDHGIHPRLMRHVHDAMVRLSNPEQYGDERKAVQVIATTHSPYLLDLFRDHPEDVVLANKQDSGATFQRLIDLPHYEDILHDAQLSDAWYSGVLGGVPASP